MLAYHFVSSNHGLANLRNRRLKVATLNDLNDPFELFSVDFSNTSIRATFIHLKAELAKNRGIICFSRGWHNPVQWSHYADSHRGLCLGFEVENVIPVEYTRRRLVEEAERISSTGELDEAMMSRFLLTKYSHWRYENEVRDFVALHDRDPETGLYFKNFGENLTLRTVIVGAQSPVTRSEVAEALGSMSNSVRVFKARLAFRTFRVVRQRNEKLWV